jgi:vancomycin resistance protein YoaR
LLAFLSKNFLMFMGRLSLAGIIVLGGFHLGSAFYVSGIAGEFEKVAVKSLAEEADTLSAGGLDIYIQEEKMAISPKMVKNWLEPYLRSYSDKEDVRISPEKMGEYLTSIALSVNIQPVNAKFILIDGRAKEFIPSEYGRSLDINASKELVLNAIIRGAKEVNLPVNLVEPAITLEKVNELGITTLIGRGESDFKGSTSSRIHNIRLGSAKFNGAIVKPDETFSFNSILGEVDENNGYQSELVIKKGKLVYEYGGGLCQVSTTLFRSAIMAGLPIVERRPHSFPVRYYDPQGFDATIYPGVVDLKFKNDTPNHILIQSRIEDSKLVFDIYGPDDGRKVVLDGPYQYDQKSNGAMRARFTRKITFADGSAKEERFDSSYGAPAPLERNPLE